MFGFGFAGAEAPLLAAVPLRALSAGVAVPTGAQTLDGGATLARIRTKHVVMAASRIVKPVFALFYVSDAGVETQIAIPAGTLFKASAELAPASGTPTTPLCRLRFGGSDTLASPGGWTIEADELDVAAFGGGLTGVAAGDVLWIKQEWIFPATGGQIGITDSTGNSTGVSGEACYYGGTGSVDLTGALTAQGGAAKATRLSRPFLLLGRHRGVAVAGIGDSITFGKGASNPAGDGGGMANGGWFAMAASSAARPHTKLAKSGDRASFWTAGNAARRIAAMAYHSHAMIALGTNDLSDTGDQAAALLASHAALRARLAAANPALAIHANLVPLRTSASSDSYATVAGQTPDSGYANADAERPAANAGLLAAVGTNLAGTFNLNPALADSAVTDRWKANGTANWSTSDGTHPSQVRAVDMATIAAPIIAGFTA